MLPVIPNGIREVRNLSSSFTNYKRDSSLRSE